MVLLNDAGGRWCARGQLHTVKKPGWLVVISIEPAREGPGAEQVQPALAAAGGVRPASPYAAESASARGRAGTTVGFSLVVLY